MREGAAGALPQCIDAHRRLCVSWPMNETFDML